MALNHETLGSTPSIRTNIMKILKEGVWKKKITCRGCNTVIEVEPVDIRYGAYVNDEDSNLKGQLYVDCPVCSKRLIQKDIPQNIEKEIIENRKD